MLAREKQNPILITGSLHFAGEVLAAPCTANPLRSKNARNKAWPIISKEALPPRAIDAIAYNFVA